MLSDGTRTYTWEHGRQLKTLTQNGTTWTYTYDTNGLRTSRSNGVVTYEYYYTGTQLSWMRYLHNENSIETDLWLQFSYNAAGVPLGVTVHNGNLVAYYYYITNIQGDVVGIVSNSGVKSVTYVYDAWGNLIEPDDPGEDTIAAVNPLRYRGYVYDQETSLYYLQSRYYNPEIGRFISADDVSYLGADGSVTSYNLFAYGGNNPIMYSDPSGHAWITSILIGLAISSLITSIASDIFGAQVVGGVSSTVGGASTIYTGVNLLAFGPVGWVAGGALILVGAGTALFGVNEVAAGVTGSNYIQEWTGMNDDLYNGLYIGLNIASTVGTIAGNAYIRYANLSGTGNPGRNGGKPLSRYATYDSHGGLKQYRFFDTQGNAWFDIDFNHGGNVKFPHYHPWINGSRFKNHLSFWQFVNWLIGS